MRSTRNPKFLLAILALTPMVSRAAAPPRISLAADSLSIASAGPTSIVFGIAREIDSDDVVTVRTWSEVLSDDDGDGNVRLDLGRAVAAASVWIAVDVGSGAFDIATPASLELRRRAWRGQGLRKRPDGRDAIEDLRGQAEVLVVRPGVGAWRLRLGDGGPSDEDGSADGRLEAALDRLVPLAGGPPPPKEFQPEDLVLLVDPNSLEVVTERVARRLPDFTEEARR